MRPMKRRALRQDRGSQRLHPVSQAVRLTALAGKCLACTATYLIFFTLNASAVNCQRFAKEAQSAIKTHVAALQGYEHEASDRLKGLDSRPFEFLRDEAKKTAAIIGEPKALA